MDYQRPQRVSVLDPVEQAISRVRQMLFTPFNMSKWFIIGFCAWLATLGQGGGSGFNFNFNDGHHSFDHGGPEFSAVKESIISNLPLILIGAAIVIPIAIIIGLVLCWLRSRGQFMFVHCIAGNVAEVAVPWNKFSHHGNSLFVFKFVVAIISIFIILIPVTIGIFSGITLSQTGFCAAGAAGIVTAVLLTIVIIIVFADIERHNRLANISCNSRR